MTNTTITNKYRFLEEEHLHQLFKDGEWKNLTGTSSIGDVLYKPLAWWASGKCAECFGWLNPKTHLDKEVEEFAKFKHEEIKKISDADYLKFLDWAYRNHDTYKKERAESGVDLHAELEKYIKNVMRDRGGTYDQKINPFIKWANENVKKFIASEANCYSEKLWIGGIIDCVAEMKDGTLAIIDFKSAKSAYPTHFIQTCFYAIQAEENGLWNASGTRNKKIDKKIETLVVVPFGMENLIPEVRQYGLVDEYRRGCECAIVLFRLLGLEKQREQLK